MYAYTIGGVAVNRTTGEVKALVIDPHYVGDDNVDLIFRKVRLLGLSKIEDIVLMDIYL